MLILMDKSELPNLSINTKNLIYLNKVNLYLLENNNYVVEFKDDFIFKLDYTGKVIDILNKLDKSNITQIYFRNTFENSINIDICI